MSNIFVKKDLDAMVGVFFDGFSKLIIAVALMTSVLNFNYDFIKSVVFPGIAFNVALFNIYFWLYGRKLQKQGQENITALPSGVIVTKMFLWMNVIMIPTYVYTNDFMVTWKVGVASSIISGLLFIVLSPFGNFIKRVIPKPTVFGTLAGIALVHLGASVLVKMYNVNAIGIIALLFFFFIYFNKNIKLSPGITMVIGITLMFWLSGNMDIQEVSTSVSQTGFYLPKLHLNIFDGIWGPLQRVLPSVIAFTIMDIFTTLMGVQQAKEVGNEYDINKTLCMSGVLNVIGGFFGSCFNCGIYWGHNTWNKLGARTGYSLGLSIIYIVIGVFSLHGIISAIIPNTAVLPFVLFIALCSIQQAFEVNDKEYYPVVTIAMMVTVCEVIIQQVNKFATGEMLLSSNFEINGYLNLSNGAIFNSLILSSILYFCINSEYRKAGITLIIAGLLSNFGLIHSSVLGIFINPEFTLMYLITGIMFIIYSYFKKVEV